MKPASSIIQAFGGHKSVAEILGCHRTRPYMWEKSKEQRGTGGLIPTDQAIKLLQHAKDHNIPVSAEDFLQVPSEAAE